MANSSDLKTFRKRNRIQLQELARAARVAPSTVSRVENGWTDLTRDTAAKLLAGYRRLRLDARCVLQRALADALRRRAG